MSIKIDQALIQSVIDGAFGLPVAYENDGYTPTTGVAYMAVSVAKNAEQGFTLSDLNDLTGFLEVYLKFPSGAGAMPAKAVETAIMDNYTIGKVLTYGGQSLEITGKDRVSARVDSGWFEILLRFNFVAYLPRITGV